MNDGSDDVAGRLVVELDDVLPEVRLDDVDPGLLQGVVEPDLFGDHGLGFDRTLHSPAPGDFHYCAVRLGGISSPMYRTSV